VNERTEIVKWSEISPGESVMIRGDDHLVVSMDSSDRGAVDIVLESVHGTISHISRQADAYAYRVVKPNAPQADRSNSGEPIPPGTPVDPFDTLHTVTNDHLAGPWDLGLIAPGVMAFVNQDRDIVPFTAVTWAIRHDDEVSEPTRMAIAATLGAITDIVQSGALSDSEAMARIRSITFGEGR
jgi:hypothetical protein